MRRLSSEEAQAQFDLWRAQELHVDRRLIREIGEPGCLFLMRLEDEESFLSLIWQEADPARLLTPAGQPRTLREVAQRVLDRGSTFGDLSLDLGLDRNQHRPEWFKPCCKIDSDFQYARFGWLTLVPACDSERQQSPHGSFYLFDGMHKSLVLATRLLRKETTYQAIEAIYMLPRR
jgi:hypothetical protein